VAARKAAIQKLRGSRFIAYPVANRIIGQLEDLLHLPKVHRMPNLLIVGETNNGKSMIVNRFLSKHKPEVHLAGEPSRFPVLVVQAPNVPDESRFYNAILSQIYAPFRASARVDQRQLQAIRMLDTIGVKLLVIDEIHNILAGTTVKQQQFRNAIRYLGNELQIPIVAVGTRDAYFAIQLDKQLENRFDVALVPKWTMDADYLRLLASFEATLSLAKASNLIETSLALKILALSEGTIGEVARLLVAAAQHAIDTGTEQIDLSVITGCGYTPPSQRSKLLA
jgi:hypothetical protein